MSSNLCPSLSLNITINNKAQLKQFTIKALLLSKPVNTGCTRSSGDQRQRDVLSKGCSQYMQQISDVSESE